MAGKPLCDDEILAAIKKHWLDFLHPPSIQYLIENSGLASKSTAWGALRRLEKRGSIFLLETAEGHKAYMKWAWHTLNSAAQRIKDEKEYSGEQNL